MLARTTTDLPHVLPAKREPSWSDAAFVAVCVLAAGLLFLVLPGLPFEAIGSDDRGARQRFTTALTRVPVLVWLLLAVLPVAAMIIYRKLRGVLTAVRSLVAGVTGASMTGIGLFFALLGVSQTVIEPSRLSAEEALFAIIILTVAGLMAGTGAALSIGLSLVWLYIFARLAGFAPSPAGRSLAVIAGLAVIIVISFALPAYLAAMSFYAVFAVLVAAPVSGLIALLMATLGLAGLRAFLRA